MNNKVYRLLRNNKEQGPFTLEELIVSGLKPYDLIWVDGRSAAWSYPGELNEFKNYVPNPDDYRNNLIVKKQEITRISSTVQAAVSMNDIIQAPAKQKPRYKVSAAWSKIQTITTPSYNDVMVAESKKSSSAKIINTQKTQPVNAKSLSWEQAWLDWENEKKTVAPVKPEAFVKIPAAPKKSINETLRTAPVLEKKFEQSIDTITDKYIDNLLLQKKKSRGFSFGKSSEFILPSLALIVIFSIGYWLMHDNKTAAITTPVTQQTVAANENKQPALNSSSAIENDNQNAASSTSGQTENNISDEAASMNVAKEKKPEHYSQNTKFVSPVKTNASSGNKTAEANSSDINLKKTNSSNSKQCDPSVINNIPRDNTYNDPSANNNGDLNAAENRPVRRRTNNADASNNNPSAKESGNTGITNAKTKSAVNYVSVPEYVTMNNGNGSLKIQNLSDADLDLVVVDVQYFDASSRFRKGETLYLHNLKAGKTVTVKTPRDINSSYATSKVSLVSSDASGVYAVGDN